ncbi:putative baseplate assembly protein [Halobacteriales archaeon QH_10_67_22]|nr:MAG: putative baseplate assembly protein [Halobacteriales archaeon QH_10_67_22]
MADGPVVDGRTREALLAQLRALADSYVDEWDVSSPDSGTTLLQVVSRFETDVVRRLDGVPEKHRTAFLDALDFSRRPPQSARLPLTVRTTADIDGNVVVPGGTQAAAETEDGDTEIFEIPADDGFEATPASLQTAWAVDPVTDTVVDHGPALTAGEGTTLLDGENEQTHALYLGHDDLLNLAGDSTVTVRLLTNASEDVVEDSLVWEYYGEDDDGEEGWHSLPQETTDVLDEDEAGIQDLRARVEERIEAYSTPGVSEWDNNPLELSFRFPGPSTDHAVAGTESRWIRARATGSASYFDIEVESLTLTVEGGAENGGVTPAELLANDVPLSVEGDEDVYPFGRVPQPPTTMYLASEEALTKKGATIQLRFGAPQDGGADENGDGDGPDEDETADTPATGARPAGLLEGEPEISWEYWDGNGWSRLGLLADGTDRLREPGTVRFEVPGDLGFTSVSGHEDYWIRARLVGGNYGQPRYEITDEGRRGDLVDRPDPPQFGRVSIGYGQDGERFQHVYTHNNASYEAVATDAEPLGLVPFEPVPDDTQTLYLGFDDTLRNGPINLFVPTSDERYPRTFDPAMRWEYCPDPESGTWEKLEVRDDTEGLTERGIASINVPEATTAFELFGTRAHWIRVRVTGDEFYRGPTGPAVRQEGERTIEHRREDRSAVADSPTPPTLQGVHPNTQWAYNERTIEGEILGSSDGSHDQAYTCNRAPVTEIELWVEEVGALSSAEMRDLERDSPEAVDRLPESGSDPVEFWVRWTEVENFLESAASDRHYRVDRTSGEIRFGDGQRGQIPPAGENNLRATYKTGGGSEGNVDAGAVEELRDPITLVDSVTNLQPSDGGADVESMDAVVSRAPERIKNKGRAVTPSDFEQVARSASRELATVKCEPEMDQRGDRRPGWVTLLVVPRGRRERPSPSMELRKRVEDAVSERAPATLTGRDQQRITVRGPNYAAVSVDATVHTRGVESVSALKAAIESRLDDFFHPLTGGRDGEGWAFGQAPRLSAVSSLLEGVDDVDTVASTAMTVQTRGQAIRILTDADDPTLDRDTLVCAGDHDVTVRMREDGGRP